MPDITLCSPTKFMKRCATCWRMTATPDELQSYANLYDECRKDKQRYYLHAKIRKKRILDKDFTEWLRIAKKGWK